DDRAIYWIDETATLRAQLKAGGPSQILSDARGALNFAIEAATAYVHTPMGADLVSVPLAGGPVTTLVHAASALSITTDGVHPYYADPFKSTIWRVRKAGGAAEIAARGHGVLAGLVVDDACLYWLDENNTASAVLARAPK